MSVVKHYNTSVMWSKKDTTSNHQRNYINLFTKYQILSIFIPIFENYVSNRTYGRGELHVQLIPHFHERLLSLNKMMKIISSDPFQIKETSSNQIYF